MKLRVSGTVTHENFGITHGPEGTNDSRCDQERYVDAFAFGALVAGVEGMTPRPTGAADEWISEMEGELCVYINDNNPSNSKGGYTLEILITRARE